MIESQNNRVHFRYYLSAFLSASRSVLQYADAETNLGKNPNARPEAQKWYLDVVKKSPRVSYFKDARDLNIHTSPISPRAHISVMFKEEIGVGESVTVSINGEKQPTIPKEHEVEVVRKEFPPEVSYKYVFDNWPESEDVIQICRKYLDELASIVKEGIAKGFISG
jgi:hypothetical protein